MNVALVGFAENTRDLSRQSSADEFWTLNRAWYFDWLEFDRLFEMHTLEYLSDPNNADTRGSQEQGYKSHWDWLQEPHDFPIYSVETYSEIPGSVRYPLEDVTEDVFHDLYRGAEPLISFASTFDYMVALAIHEQVERIEVYGFEMATGTEYQYQQNSGNILMGIAAGRGIEVVIPEESILIPRMKLYGYEGAQMISRQTLESYKRMHEDEKERWKAVANAYLGQLQLPPDNGQLEEIQRKFSDAQIATEKYDATIQLLEMLIAECDMLEVDPRIEQKFLVTNAFEEVE